MPDNKHHHRAGGLRQSNKRNKRSTVSKRAARGAGKTNHLKQTVVHKKQLSKADRRNHAQQKRLQKQQQHNSSSKNPNNHRAPPRIIGIVSLGDDIALEERVREALTKSASQTIQHTASVTCRYDVFKQEITILTTRSTRNSSNNNNNDSVIVALDMARVCDALLLVVNDSDALPKESDDAHLVGLEIGTSTIGSITATSSKCSSGSNVYDRLISERGDRFLSAIKSQGLPTPVTILAHTLAQDNYQNMENIDDDGIDDAVTMFSVKSVRRSQHKRQLELKRYVSRLAVTELGSQHDKVLELDLTMSEAMQNEASASTQSTMLVRTLCTMACRPAKWVTEMPRPYLVADTYQYDDSTQQLQLTGYIRSGQHCVPWDVHALVHVPGLGTVACHSIASARASATPLPQQRTQQSHSPLVVIADPSRRESLNSFATPDALDGEQNLIGFDENNIEDTENVTDNHELTGAERPAGWSDYQSAWLDAVDENDNEEDEAIDRGELAEELNMRGTTSSIVSDGMDLGNDHDEDDINVAEANHLSETERQTLQQERQKQQTDEQDFPDEVQVGEDESARDRFARYRSLKSFRKSQWDPKENLPDSYASIYHFASFKQTQRSVLNEMKQLVREAEAIGGTFFGKTPISKERDAETMEVQNDNGDIEDDNDFLEGCIPSGSYVTITLENVAKDAVSSIRTGTLLTAVALLPHENKASVLHMGLSQIQGCDTTVNIPIKSKDILTFRCGWRTWQARPVFSQNNLNCDKHKFERFLPTGGAFFAASIFGPVTYTPCPVLVFRENNSVEGAPHSSELVAVGSIMGADADRIVIKRIILTGYPVRVHKRHATVKYMFYNPEDVKWFKPAALYTKHGLQGNIVQSVGEHGTMKCLFNAPIKQHDTVCLPLYKRIYPKYATNAAGEGRYSCDESRYKEGSLNLVVR